MARTRSERVVRCVWSLALLVALVLGCGSASVAPAHAPEPASVRLACRDEWRDCSAELPIVFSNDTPAAVVLEKVHVEKDGAPAIELDVHARVAATAHVPSRRLRPRRR